ncbi:MAG: hypothetical protein ACOCY7_02835 [Halodesulfurarchaeum sp.]
MSLDVDAPHPPDLSTSISRGPDQHDPSITRRSDIETMLHDGAWREAFGEWADGSDLTDAEWTVVLDLALIQEFDFGWDQDTEQVWYHAPSIADDWRDRDLHPNLDSWATVAAINHGLDTLGRTVADLLEMEYVDWDTEEPRE